MGSLFDDIISEDNVRVAHRNTLKGKLKYRSSCVLFNMDEAFNLHKLIENLKQGNYSPLPYNRFFVYEPKKRLIYAPHYRDKIVHHMVNNVLRDYFEPKFIYHSFACIRNKGHRNAVESLRKMSHSCKISMRDPYVISIDIKKFFYSIDKDLMKVILSENLPCDKTIKLCHIIIDSTPEGHGLPLGNLASQLFANILMNLLDQFAKHQLNLKHYVRYCDDIIAVVDGKHHAREVRDSMCYFIKEFLHLSPHEDKTIIYPLKHGIRSLGFVYKEGKVLLTRQTKNNAKKKINQALEYDTKVDAQKKIQSVINHLLIATSLSFIRAMAVRYGFSFTIQGSACRRVNIITK